jgi:hypothetical protein
MDPQRILSELPAREHGTFLAVYRRAVDVRGIRRAKLSLRYPELNSEFPRRLTPVLG